MDTEFGDLLHIYYEDLNEEAKLEFLKIMGITCPEEGNYDVYPIAELVIGEDAI